MDRPTFLKFHNRWVNLALVSHVEFDEAKKTATVFFGDHSVRDSKEAYQFFKREPPEYLFTKSVG